MKALSDAIEACIQNGQRLTKDADLLHELERFPTSYAVAILAQEEFAKSFILTLVRDDSIPWTEEVRKALYSHECKHLIGLVMEWVYPSFEKHLDRGMAFIRGEQPEDVPNHVATAINILRHEKLEKFKSGWSDKEPEWKGISRKVAEGWRDREKQRSLYIGISKDGWIDSFHPALTTREMASDEINRAKQYAECAHLAFAGLLSSREEYRRIREGIKAVFEDLAKDRS